MSRRAELYIFVALLIVLGGALYYANRTKVPGFTGVLAADAKFQPLDVQAPQLHLDQLAALRKERYAGSHRNIFVAVPPPPPKMDVPPMTTQATEGKR